MVYLRHYRSANIYTQLRNMLKEQKECSICTPHNFTGEEDCMFVLQGNALRYLLQTQKAKIFLDCLLGCSFQTA